VRTVCCECAVRSVEYVPFAYVRVALHATSTEFVWLAVTHIEFSGNRLTCFVFAGGALGEAASVCTRLRVVDLLSAL
jgi:hypothetical protein